MKAPVRVTITGAAGQIGYQLAFRIASGQMLGNDQPVILQLLEIPPALPALQGVVMELDDCAFGTLAGIVATDDPNVAFKDADYALLVGARPRGPGMERKDLLEANAAIFSVQGKAMNDHASRDIKVLVVGNPANTNALIAQANAPDIDPRNFTAMTRLDHNRAMAQLAAKTGSHVNDIKLHDDLGQSLGDAVPGHQSRNGRRQERHGACRPGMAGRRVHSGRAAARRGHHQGAWRIVGRVSRLGRDRSHARLGLGTPDGDWVSMAIPADGSYGIEPGIIYSYPVRCSGGDYEIVQGLDIDDFSRERMDATEAELREERAAIEELL